LIRLCKGDSLNLPYFGKELNSSKLSFYKFIEVSGRNKTLQNLLSSLKIDNNSLIIENL
jgi:hypothetical protein